MTKSVKPLRKRYLSERQAWKIIAAAYKAKPLSLNVVRIRSDRPLCTGICSCIWRLRDDNYSNGDDEPLISAKTENSMLRKVERFAPPAIYYVGLRWPLGDGASRAAFCRSMIRLLDKKQKSFDKSKRCRKVVA